MAQKQVETNKNLKEGDLARKSQEMSLSSGVGYIYDLSLRSVYWPISDPSSDKVLFNPYTQSKVLSIEVIKHL